MRWRTANNRRRGRRDSRLIVYDLSQPAKYLYPRLTPISRDSLRPPTEWERAASRVECLKLRRRFERMRFA